MDDSLFLENYNMILIRYSGEIWLKSTKVKMRMVKTLMNNIKRMLNRVNLKFHKYQLSKDSSRIFYFFSNEDIPRAVELFKKVFGIYSFSPALRTSNKMKNIKERTLEVAEVILEKHDSFALRVKRSGVHDYSSHDVAVKVGAEIMENFQELNLSVDLTNPKKKIYIEVRDNFTYIFTDIIHNYWEGLPLSKRNQIFVMDCGRIDDLLAGFLLMRRGAQIFPILFDVSNERERVTDKWVSRWKVVRDFISFNKFFLQILDLSSLLEEILTQTPKKEYTCALCRLVRLDILAKLNDRIRLFKDVKAYSDGLNLNNDNYCIDTVDLQSIALNYLFSQNPIFTSIVAMDKSEIKERLNKIDKNLKEFDYCKFKPKNQEIDLEEVKKLYQSLNTDKLIEECINNIKQINLS